MSTIYDTEALITKAIADRAKLPAMIDAAMREHAAGPTAQGALSLARSLCGFMVLTNLPMPSGIQLVISLLAEASALGATRAEVDLVGKTALDNVRRVGEGYDKVEKAPPKDAD